VCLVGLPPSGLALNPIERVWRDLKEALAWLPFPTLAGQQDDVTIRLRADEAATLHPLTGYPYLIRPFMHDVPSEVISGGGGQYATTPGGGPVHAQCQAFCAPIGYPAP
jgi:hypothetical protein